MLLLVGMAIFAIADYTAVTAVFICLGAFLRRNRNISDEEL